MSVELSVIIVHYQTPELTLKSVQSVLEYGGAETQEIILINNGCSDLSRESVFRLSPNIKYLNTQSNLGYSAANNIGIGMSEGKWILLFNSDAKLLTPNTFRTLIDCAQEDPETGIAGPRHVDFENRYQVSSGSFPSFFSELKRKLIYKSLSVSDYKFREYLDGKASQSDAADWVSGSCMLIRRTVIEKTGLLDQNFFMYFEDIDFCRRAADAGFKVKYFPEVTVSHFGGASARSNILSVHLHNRKSQLYFTRKYYGKSGLILLRILMCLKFSVNFIQWMIIFLMQRLLGVRSEMTWAKVLLSKRVVEITFQRLDTFTKSDFK